MNQEHDCNVNDLGCKAKLKRELMRVLSVEGKMYLQPYKEANMRYLTQIVKDEKKVVFKALDTFTNSSS